MRALFGILLALLVASPALAARPKDEIKVYTTIYAYSGYWKVTIKARDNIAGEYLQIWPSSTSEEGQNLCSQGLGDFYPGNGEKTYLYCKFPTYAQASAWAYFNTNLLAKIFAEEGKVVSVDFGKTVFGLLDGSVVPVELPAVCDGIQYDLQELADHILGVLNAMGAGEGPMM